MAYLNLKRRRRAEKEELLLGLSSLSRISRNSRKLMRVPEFLLAHRARILTTNYLITCKEVWVRRHELVPDSERPVNGFRELRRLSGSHRKTVESYVRQVSQGGARPAISRPQNTGL